MSAQAHNPKLRQPIKRRVPRRDFERRRWHGGLMFGENVTTGAVLHEDGGKKLTEAGEGRRSEDVVE